MEIMRWTLLKILRFSLHFVRFMSSSTFIILSSRSIFYGSFGSIQLNLGRNFFFVGFSEEL